MTWIDLWENTYDRIELPRRHDCPACGQAHYEYLDAATGCQGTSLCGRNAVQVRAREHGTSVDLAELAERLRPVGEVGPMAFCCACASMATN